ncbi:MAG: hypothetical protein ABH879_11050 [archaeon]
MQMGPIVSYTRLQDNGLTHAIHVFEDGQVVSEKLSGNLQYLYLTGKKEIPSKRARNLALNAIFSMTGYDGSANASNYEDLCSLSARVAQIGKSTQWWYAPVLNNHPKELAEVVSELEEMAGDIPLHLERMEGYVESPPGPLQQNKEVVEQL